MQPELQQYFEHLLDLFIHPGWEEMKEDMTDALEQTDIDYCNTAEDFWKMKGRREVYQRFLNYEEVIKRAYEEQLSEDSD